jgi:hypothetical protein
MKISLSNAVPQPRSGAWRRGRPRAKYTRSGHNNHLVAFRRLDGDRPHPMIAVSGRVVSQDVVVATAARGGVS